MKLNLFFYLTCLVCILISCEGARDDANNYSPESDQLITIKDDESMLIEEMIIDEVEYPEDELLDFAEEEPEFPGGEAAMNEFIQNNVEYPQNAIEMGEQGIVYVQFIVDKTGSINNVEVVRGVSTSLDNEAKRVIRKMPKWNPGKQNGELVNVRFTIPISFKLS